MTAILARTGCEPNAATEERKTKRVCGQDKPSDFFQFKLGDRVCWAVRIDIAGTPEKQLKWGSDARSLCGWLRVGKEIYLVLTQPSADKADERTVQEGTKRDAWETLSDRQMQIAILVSLGKGTKRIAAHLHISEHTVQSHMRRIFSKLNVSSRPAMVAQLVASQRFPDRRGCGKT
jgi:DNA-binding CsgD family transcriptional regulator